MPAFTIGDVDFSGHLDKDSAAEGTTLYSLIKANDPRGVYTHLAGVLRSYLTHDKSDNSITSGSAVMISMQALFDRIFYDTETKLDDKTIIYALYEGGHGDAIKAIAGNDCGDATLFMKKLNAALSKSAEYFYAGIATLATKSFELTYDHNDVADLLGTTKVTLQGDLVRKRLYETSKIMELSFIHGRSIVVAMMINEMHVERFKLHKRSETDVHYYNQGSVLFTLLTFSYVVMADLKSNNESTVYDESKWYWFWRIFGSLLGCATSMLPESHADAARIFNDFYGARGMMQGSKSRAALRKVYRDDVAAVLSGKKKRSWEDYSFGLGVTASSWISWAVNKVFSAEE